MNSNKNESIDFYNSSNVLKKNHNYKESIRLLIILLVILFLVFFILLFLDKYHISAILKLLNEPNTDNVINNLLANVGGDIIFGLLGIVMTVVAIIVELAANRYTARVTDLFIRDKINMIFLILLISTGINQVLILYFSRLDKIPIVLINITVFIITFCLLALVPYFIYVFKFLEPNNIISKIEKDILNNTKKVRSIKNILLDQEKKRKKINKFQAHIVDGIDQLTDIVLNSIQKKDNILATNCIRSISNYSNEYIELKNNNDLDELWFYPSDYVRYNNADFVTLMEESFKLIVKEKTWVEHKLFRQLKIAFEESVNMARDICSFISQCFYIIGITAIKANDIIACRLIIKYFNTLIRITINEKDVRSCFNLLNQYRLFGEGLIQVNNEELIIDIAYYFKYYGLLANENKNLSFIMETITHDLCDLNKKLYLKGLDKKGEILDIILKIDQPFDGEKYAVTLRGVRKAQIILAVFYISQGTKESLNIARYIFNELFRGLDYKEGELEKLFTIIKELKYLKEDFWEIIDRGFNIDFVPMDHRKYLQEFLDWIIARNILLYSKYLSKNNINKGSNLIIKEFIDIIKKVPVETPVELKDFEAVYGKNKIDNRKNVLNSILNVIKKIINRDNLKNEIKNIEDFNNIHLSQKALNDFIKGIKDFEKKLVKYF